MQINRKLNLVVPIDRPDGSRVYLHSTPISFEVFEQFDLVLGRTYAAIYELGVGATCGPQMVMGMMKRLAAQLDPAKPAPGESQWERIQAGLLPEIRRLTMVIVSGQRPKPYDVAVSRQELDADDQREAMGAILFFMLVSVMSKRSQVEERLNAAGRAWGFVTTLQDATAWAASFPTLTQEESSGETPKGTTKPAELEALSIPR